MHVLPLQQRHVRITGQSAQQVISLHCYQQVIITPAAVMLLALMITAPPPGPEPGLTRDPTSGWIKHAGFSIQLVDTAGWKRATAAAPTQGPTATGKQQQQQQQRVNAVTSSSSAVDNSSSSSSTSRLLADASLAQAKRALSAVHVVVLLLDAPRLITLQLVRLLVVVELGVVLLSCWCCRP